MKLRDLPFVSLALSGVVVRFHAAFDRRILGFWRCRVDARSADGRLLLSGLVAVAPGAGP